MSGEAERRENFQRLTRLLIAGGTAVLRDVFDAHFPPSNLPTILLNYKSFIKPKLDARQRVTLYPSPGTYGSSDAFDVTLMTLLLREISGIRPPTSGKWAQMPADGDILLSDDIVRLRLYRNEVYAHVITMEIDDIEFKDKWDKIRGMLLRLAGSVSADKEDEWKEETTKLLTAPLTLSDELNVAELKRWYAQDAEVKDTLLGIEAGIGQVKAALSELRDHVQDEGPQTCHKKHHANKLLDHFCHDCREFGCEMCVMMHMNHRFYNTANDPVLARIKDDIKNGIEKAKSRISDCEGEIGSLDQEVSSSEIRLQMVEKVVHNYVEKCIDYIHKKERELIQEVEKIRLHTAVEAENQKSRIYSYREETSQIVQYAEALLENGHVHEISQEAATVKMNLQQQSSLEFLSVPLAAKGKTFSPNTAFLDNLSANGIGRITSVDPMLCRAEGPGVSPNAKIHAGLQTQFIVSTFTAKGEMIHSPYEAMTVSVTYKPDDVKGNAPGAVTQDITANAKDNRDGTFTVSYIPPLVGNCYVAVMFNGVHISGSSFKVKVLPREYTATKKLGKKGQGQGDFDGPWCTAENSAGEIFVTDRYNNRVQVFNQDGSYERTIGEFGSGDGQLIQPRGVASNSDDDVIVTDTGNHRVQVFHKDGSFKLKFGGAGSVAGCMQSPYGVALDNQENIIISDLDNQRIQVFSPVGDCLKIFGHSGPEGIVQSYYCIYHDKHYIVSDAGSHCIKIFDREGAYICKFGKEGKKNGSFDHLRGLAIDKSGYLLVCDSWNDRVQVFKPDGCSFEFVGKFGSEGEKLGKFKQPTTVTVLRDGRFVICEFHNSRVQIFD